MEKKEEQEVTTYFEKKDEAVTRGELLEVLTQTMSNIDNELTKSFYHVAKLAGLLDIVIKELDKKGVLSIKDLEETIKHNIEEGQEDE